jgi:O-antigen/teichoic acid export membrane protein
LILFCVPPFLLVAITGNWIVRPSTWQRMERKSVRDLVAFVRESLAATATGAISSRLDVISTGWTLPATELGRLTAATTLAQVPEIAATYTSGALAPLIIPHVQQGTFLNWFRRVTAGGVLACLVILLCTPFVIATFGSVLPQKYHQSLDLIRILIPGYLASALIFPVALNFVLFHRPRIFVRYDILTFPFLLLAYYWSGKLFGLVGIAWASSINRIIKSLWIHISVFRIAQKKEF